MIRFRVWLSTLAATLLVAAPALAYSWTALLGLPAVFGQECPRSQPQSNSRPALPVVNLDQELKDLLVQVQEAATSGLLFDRCKKDSAVVLPYGEEKPARCLTESNCEATRRQLVRDCMATWQKLWQQGKFREAYSLAQFAAQASPENLDARHALAVSQLVNDLRFPSVSEMFTFPCENVCPAGNAGCKSDVRAAPLYVPTGTSRRPTESDLRCEDHAPTPTVPIVILPPYFESGITPAGTLTPDLNVPQKSSGFNFDVECRLSQCPLTAFFDVVLGLVKNCQKSSCCECPLASGRTGCGVTAPTTRMQPPTMVWIVSQPTNSYAPVSSVPILPAPPAPPPYFAPPVPMPLEMVGFVPVMPPVQPAQVIYETRSEIVEVPPTRLQAPSDVRILQQGGHVHLTSAHYEAHCERIRGGANGQLILEGTVRLMSRRHGQTMTIRAERVVLNVREDQFVVEQAQGMDASRVNIAPVGYTTPVRYDPSIPPGDYYYEAPPIPRP